MSRACTARFRGWTPATDPGRVGPRCRAPVARQAHNLEVGGSTPPIATRPSPTSIMAPVELSPPAQPGRRPGVGDPLEDMPRPPPRRRAGIVANTPPDPPAGSRSGDGRTGPRRQDGPPVT